jgi:hypothetical protein
MRLPEDNPESVVIANLVLFGVGTLIIAIVLALILLVLLIS